MNNENQPIRKRAVNGEKISITQKLLNKPANFDSFDPNNGILTSEKFQKLASMNNLEPEDDLPFVSLKKQNNTKTYGDKLKSPKWQRKRLEIMQRDDWTCQLCGDIETELHVHHKKYSGDPWDAPNDALITLCKRCHEDIEWMKKSGTKEEVKKIHRYKTIDESQEIIFIKFISNGLAIVTNTPIAIHFSADSKSLPILLEMINNG